MTYYRKNPKNLDTQKIAVIILKFEQLVKCIKKDADRMANSVDLDQEYRNDPKFSDR